MKNNVGFLMAKHGIGPTRLSKELNVARNTIYRMLRHETPSAETMLKVAKYFEKDVSDIFYDESVQQIARKDDIA